MDINCFQLLVSSTGLQWIKIFVFTFCDTGITQTAIAKCFTHFKIARQQKPEGIHEFILLRSKIQKISSLNDREAFSFEWCDIFYYYWWTGCNFPHASYASRWISLSPDFLKTRLSLSVVVRRPASVVRQHLYLNIFSSATTHWILTKLNRYDAWVVLYQTC